MKRYLYNIWLAFCGADIVERERTLARQEQAAADRKEAASYQTLVENLRERVGEMDRRIADTERQHRQEMADLHACYKEQTQQLQKELRETEQKLWQAHVRLAENARASEDNFNFE